MTILRRLMLPWLITLSLVRLSTAGTLNLMTDWKIPITGHVAMLDDQYYFVETMDLCLGMESKAQGLVKNDCDRFSMAIDLDSSLIMLPNARISDQHTYGYSCTPQVYCKVASDLHPCEYNLTVGYCNTAFVPMRFFSDETFESENPPLMNFSLMNSTVGWELGKYGILGLSPKSPFWGYIREAADWTSADKDFLQFSLSYNLMSTGEVYRLDRMMLRDSYFLLNSMNIERNSVTVEQPPEESNWIIRDLEIIRFNEDTPRRYNACISNSLNYFLYIQNFTTEWQPRIMTQLCGKSDGCVANNSIIGDVENIFFALYKPGNDESRVKVILDPNDYINFDENGNAVVVLGDVSADIHHTCPPDTQLILGRLFFSKVDLVVQVKRDGGFQIGLHKEGENFRIFFVLWNTVIFNFLLIVSTLLVLRTVRRNSTAYMEAHYRAIVEGYRRDYDMLRKAKKAVAISQPVFDLRTFTVACNGRGTF